MLALFSSNEKIFSWIVVKKDLPAGIKNDLKNFKDLIDQYSNEVKWNQDLTTQKENQINMYKEKLKKTEEDLKNATKAYTNLKSNISIVDKKEKEVSEEVFKVQVGKPYLFGPEN